MSHPSSLQTLTFENQFSGSFTITDGKFKLVEGLDVNPDPDGFIGDPAVERLIQVDQPVTISLSWVNGGTLRSFVAGSWKGEVFLEQMGPDERKAVGGIDAIPSNSIAYDPTQSNYVLDIVLPANSVLPGMYRIVVSLSFEGTSGKQGPVAAFGDLGLVKFYKEEQ